MTTYIYILIDPRTNTPEYVGKANILKHRLTGHINKTNTKKGKLNKKEAWIKSLLNKGIRPIIESIDEIPINEWEFWESHYISLFKSWFLYLNLHYLRFLKQTPMTQETKNKLRLANLGKKNSQESKDKVSLKNKGKIPPNKGIPWSDEIRKSHKDGKKYKKKK